MNFTDSFSDQILNIANVFFSDLTDSLIRKTYSSKKNPTLNRVGF